MSGMTFNDIGSNVSGAKSCANTKPEGVPRTAPRTHSAPSDPNPPTGFSTRTLLRMPQTRLPTQARTTSQRPQKYIPPARQRPDHQLGRLHQSPRSQDSRRSGHTGSAWFSATRICRQIICMNTRIGCRNFVWLAAQIQHSPGWTRHNRLNGVVVNLLILIANDGAPREVRTPDHLVRS